MKFIFTFIFFISVFYFIFFLIMFLIHYLTYHIKLSLQSTRYHISVIQKKCLRIQQINFMLLKQQIVMLFLLQKNKIKKTSEWINTNQEKQKSIMNHVKKNMICEKKITVFLIRNINNFKILINNINFFY